MKPRYCSIDVFKMVCLYGGFKSTSTRRMGDWPLFNEEVTTQCRALTPEILDEAEKMWKEGVCGRVIAEELGIGYYILMHKIERNRDRFPYRRIPVKNKRP